MQTVLNWFYQLYGNMVSMVFSWQIVEGVTLGSFLLVLGVFGLVSANIVMLARRN